MAALVATGRARANPTWPTQDLEGSRKAAPAKQPAHAPIFRYDLGRDGEVRDSPSHLGPS